MSVIFEGAISVKSALESKYRSVKKIWMDETKKTKDFGYILAIACKENIEVERVSSEVINGLASGKTHGGVIAEVSSREYSKISDVTDVDNPFLVLIEGVEDGYNIGYALRSLYASGCNGVLFSKYVMNDEALIAKSSAGASEKMPIVIVEDTKTVLEHIVSSGIKVICAMRKDAVSMYEANFNTPVLLAIGGPKRGLSSSVLDYSNQNIYIPYATDFRNALNASSAISILAYEVYRQRD